MSCCKAGAIRLALLTWISLGVVSQEICAQAPEAAGPSTFPALDWLRDYLNKYSAVSFPYPEGGIREVVCTATPGLHAADAFVLSYERVSHAKAGRPTIETRQLILYDINPAWLDRGSIAVQKEGGAALGEDRAYWMVRVAVNQSPGYIGYDNLFESRTENGEPETTRSRGRVREIVLGYFGSEEIAKGLALKFREYLGGLTPAPAAPVRGAGRSGA